MSKQTFGKFKRIFRTYGIQLSGGIAILWGVVKLVGTPSENYRRLEQSKNDHSELNYFDKEVYRAIQEVCVDGKSGVRYWHQYADERKNAEQLKRKKIQELLREGKGSEKEAISELRKMDNTVIKDSLSMLSKPEDNSEEANS